MLNRKHKRGFKSEKIKIMIKPKSDDTTARTRSNEKFLIVIEGDVYRVTQRQLRKIRALEEELSHNCTYMINCEMEMREYLDKEKVNFESLGSIRFDFRL